MTDIIQVHVTIKGRVQGVFYRASTQNEAERLGIKGWVKNMPNGDVQAVFQSDPTLIEQILEWCWQGPPASRVDKIEKTGQNPQKIYTTFEVRY